MREQRKKQTNLADLHVMLLMMVKIFRFAKLKEKRTLISYIIQNLELLWKRYKNRGVNILRIRYSLYKSCNFFTNCIILFMKNYKTHILRCTEFKESRTLISHFTRDTKIKYFDHCEGGSSIRDLTMHGINIIMCQIWITQGFAFVQYGIPL